MAFVQMMCARIGMVTGKGFAGALRDKLPKSVMVIICLTLLIANTLNVGADLAGMADAAEILTGMTSHIYVVLFGIGIAVAIIRFRYHQIAHTLKWLALTLFAFVITAFLLNPDWVMVGKAAAVPSVPNSAGWGMLVAILGTTISPYLFFWQASQEVEEEKAMGRRMLINRIGATDKEIKNRILDVVWVRSCPIW
jgi:Mn2+/Fe2+ NRAMP family transporter